MYGIEVYYRGYAIWDTAYDIWQKQQSSLKQLNINKKNLQNLQWYKSGDKTSIT